MAPLEEPAMNVLDPKLTGSAAETEAGDHRVGGRLDRRRFLIGAAFAAAVGVSQARMPRRAAPRIAKDRFESWMPNVIGPWSFYAASGVVLPPPDSLSDRLYDNLITRVYTAEREPMVMVAIAYNNIQNGVIQVHRPEFCYPAGGFRLSPTQFVEVDTLRRPIYAGFFSATNYERTEQVLYWTRVGDDYPRTWAEQRLAVVRANLRGIIPDGMLARVSVVADQPREALVKLQEFVRAFEAASPAPLQKLLLG